MTLIEIINFLGASVALWFSMRKGKTVQPIFPGGIPIVDILDQVKRFVDGLALPHDQKATLAKSLLQSLTAPPTAGFSPMGNPPPFVPSNLNSGP